MERIKIVDHPLVAHHLTILRDKQTPASQFREQVQRLGSLLGYNATQDLPLQPRVVQTPIQAMEGQELSIRLGIVPILRAGLGLVEPLLDLVPEAEVWHLGMYRDEATSQPVEYYCKLPAGRPCDIAFVVDPMLATGGSAVSAIETLQSWGCQDIRLLSLIASAAGVERILKSFSSVQLFVAAVDPQLNENNFIVPGLGDAGDRIFNTQ